MKKQKPEWQKAPYKKIAQQMQKQLCDCMTYGENIRTVYIGGEYHMIFGEKHTNLEPCWGYGLWVNLHEIQNVVSFCCMADSENLVAFSVTGDGCMVPVFQVTGDIGAAKRWYELAMFGTLIAEHNRIIKTNPENEKEYK